MRIKDLFLPCLLIGIIGALTNCTHSRAYFGRDAGRSDMPTFEKTVDRRFVPQIRSLTLSGQDQASFVVGLSRELRLTTDAGQTWTVVPGPTDGDAFECVGMRDAYRGWAVNHQGQVFATQSAGANWTKIAEPKGSKGSGIQACQQIEFLNENVGWILEGLSIWGTKDGGVTWQEKISVLTPGVEGDMTRIYPIDTNTLIAAGTNGQMFLTRDGGDTWKINTITDQGSFTDVSFADKQNGWLSGYIGGNGFRGLLFATKDGGASWEELPFTEKEVRPTSISFLGDDAWLAGYRRLRDTDQSLRIVGIVMHTIDGGKNWNSVQLDSDDPFFNIIRFVDKDHGWLAGRDNLYRTENGGKTWIRVLSLPKPQ